MASMANVVDAVWSKATAFVARWLGVIALVVFVTAQAAAVSVRRRVSARSTRAASACRLPPVGQQLLDPAVQVHRQPSENVLQVSPGVVPVELGRLRQAHHDRRPLTCQLTPNEEPVAAPMDIST